MTGAKSAASEMGGCCGGDGFAKWQQNSCVFIVLSPCLVEFHTAHASPRHPPSILRYSFLSSSLPKPKSFRLQEMLLCPPPSPPSPVRRNELGSISGMPPSPSPLPPTLLLPWLLPLMPSPLPPPTSVGRSFTLIKWRKCWGLPPLSLFLLTNVTQRLCWYVYLWQKEGIVRTVRAARERTNLFPRQKFSQFLNSNDCFTGN